MPHTTECPYYTRIIHTIANISLSLSPIVWNGVKYAKWISFGDFVPISLSFQMYLFAAIVRCIESASAERSSYLLACLRNAKSVINYMKNVQNWQRTIYSCIRHYYYFLLHLYPFKCDVSMFGTYNEIAAKVSHYRWTINHLLLAACTAHTQA